jgi:hypothetical protein
MLVTFLFEFTVGFFTNDAEKHSLLFSLLYTLNLHKILATKYLVAVAIINCTFIFSLNLGIGCKICKRFSLMCGTDNLVLNLFILCSD